MVAVVQLVRARIVDLGVVGSIPISHPNFSMNYDFVDASKMHCQKVSRFCQQF